MATSSRSLSDLRRQRGQDLAALNRVRRRGLVLLEINGTRAELWSILKELDDALRKLQDSNWNYFDRISDDEFERERAERYEEDATDKCTELQDMILARLRDEQNDASIHDRKTMAAKSELGTAYGSVESSSDVTRQRKGNEDENIRSDSSEDEQRRLRQNTKRNYESTHERYSDISEPRFNEDEAQSRIDNEKRRHMRTNENHRNSTPMFRQCLPRLELVTFSGDVSDWPRWYSLFKSLVDEQPLSTDEKMAHLQNSVTGLARHTIGGMLYDGGLYHDALAALKDRFGRDEDIIHANLSRVFAAPSPTYLDPRSLEQFHGALHCAVTVLQNMGYEGDLCSTENLRRAVQKLPSEMKRDWGEYAIDLHKPNLIHLDKWLQRQVRIALNYAAVSNASARRMTMLADTHRVLKNNRTTLTTEASAAVPRYCPCCKSGIHQLDECSSFIQMNVRARAQFVFANRRCFSCLKKGHLARYCRHKEECGINGCDQNHHKLLHDESRETEEENQEQRAVACLQKNQRTLLQIVPVRVLGPEGRSQKTLALLDPGSQTSLCANTLVKNLRLSGTDTHLTLKHIGGTGPSRRSKKFQLRLRPLTGEDDEEILVSEAFSVPGVNIRTPTISARDMSRWKHLQDLPIPDCTQGKIEVLLGANVLEAVLQKEVRVGDVGQPVAIRTAFGWTITGSVTDFIPETTREVMCIEHTDGDEQLVEIIRQWWATESFGTLSGADNSSREDTIAQALLESTAKKCGDRYEVGILWRNPEVTMPQNKIMAVRRLQSLEKNLLRHPEKAKAYQEAVQSYIEKGHARKVPKEELNGNSSRKRWFLPHHAVTNPKKKKIRVVFDAAAVYHGKSLNSELLKGPDLLQNLTGILLRFRQEKIALVADIEEMFHQIRIIEDDQPAMSFLWRNLDTFREPEVYQMTVSVFGMKCSPAIASYVLRKTAEDHYDGTLLSAAAVLAVKQNFYMDDLLRSESDVETAVKLQREVTRLVARGGFRLTKWVSNSAEVLRQIDVVERAHPDPEAYTDDMHQERALGCVWFPSRDVLGIPSQICVTSLTKRGLLQGVASIFDPLGIVSPFTLKAKLLIQRLWALKYAWDDQLTGDELEECEHWLSQAKHLREVLIPRCFKGLLECELYRSELHVFCDASENGFAAVAYIRIISAQGKQTSSFAMSRARLAPLKQLTIVRLELQAAVLAVRLADTIKREMTYTFDETVFWSDSKIVLHYIQNESRRFHTFVANRVSEIHGSSKVEEWRHISGKDNPADVGSRGTSLSKLKDLKVWWRGPAFLEVDRDKWPIRSSVTPDLDPADVEVKVPPVVVAVLYTNTQRKLLDTERFSSYTKYRRIFAWVIRFVEKLKAKKKQTEIPNSSFLSSAEMEKAELHILREDQMCHVPGVTHMSPYVDPQGILRVGGRLGRAPVPHPAKHPIIMSPRSDLTRLIVRDIHERLMHSGLQHTLNEFRLRFWMPKARGAIKKIIYGCSYCRNRRSRPTAPLMSDLPDVRFDQSCPFSSVGIDYFGPLLVRKFRKTEKRFVLLVTCLATRALHLELAAGLDTDSFLLALRRFIARRGKPKIICSDRGTNFVGGEKEIRNEIETWNEAQITDYLSQRHIEWKWNPPASPHMGGVWERLVASVKRALRVVLGSQCVAEDVLHTTLVEVEYMLNGRPLTYVSSDERDPEALTPNHFLLGSSDTGAGLPPGVFSERDLSGTRRWRQAQLLTDQVWKRWRKEYLPTLLSRQKWQSETDNLQLGAVVLIVDENTPRGLWPLARVVKVYPSTDGRVRSADVKTANGVYRRPVNKLCLLEAPSND